MTGPELAAALGALDISRRALARRLGCSETLIRRMEAGTRPVGPALAAWLRAAAAWRERHPVPAAQGGKPGRRDASGAPPQCSARARFVQRGPINCKRGCNANPNADEPNYYGDHGDAF